MHNKQQPTASRGKTLTVGEAFDVIVNDPAYEGKPRGEFGENAGEELECLVNIQPSQEELDEMDEYHRRQDPNGLLG